MCHPSIIIASHLSFFNQHKNILILLFVGFYFLVYGANGHIYILILTSSFELLGCKHNLVFKVNSNIVNLIPFSLIILAHENCSYIIRVFGHLT